MKSLSIHIVLASLFQAAIGLLATLFILGCTKVEIPNIRVCAVSGIMAAGADCAYTLEDRTESLDLEQFIKFLQPDEAKGPALCQSSEDFMKLKVALEQVCDLSKSCTKRVKDKINNVFKRVIPEGKKKNAL